MVGVTRPELRLVPVLALVPYRIYLRIWVFTYFHLKVVSSAMSYASRCGRFWGGYPHDVKIEPWVQYVNKRYSGRWLRAKPYEADVRGRLCDPPLTRGLLGECLREIWIPSQGCLFERMKE